MTETEPDQLSEEEQQELLKELERKRSLRGTAAVAVSAVAILFSAFQTWLAAKGIVFAVTVPFVGRVGIESLQTLQIRAIHVAFALVLAFMLFPPSTGDGFVARRLQAVPPAVRERFGDSPVTSVVEALADAVRWFAGDPEGERITPLDGVLSLFAVLSAFYFLTELDEIINVVRSLGLNNARTVGEVYPILAPLEALPILGESSWAYLLGLVGVLLVLEATRRTLGFYLMTIVSSFIVYAKYGWLIDPATPFIGVLSITDTSWAIIIRDLWYNTSNGVFGIPVGVSVDFIFIFILFGAFLEMSGAGKWFIDLAYAATGKRRGGPAKASILASGFMGTISGSSIANTVTTGAFTIPLMKRSGYRPSFAGAVEASASSGGQILPPVMGAAAFLIVEYTLTPYADVILAAAIPAVVFFFGVWVMVHLEASRLDIGAVEGIETVTIREHMKRGWFYLVPIGLLLYYLIIEVLSVARAAWYTLFAITALIALVAAYNEDTRGPLVGSIAGLALLDFAAHLLTGAGLVGAVLGQGTGAMSPEAALLATAGGIGWIILGVSVAVMLARPSIDPPLLEYDDQVDDSAETVADSLDRRALADRAPFRFLTFILKSMDSGARTATTVVIAVAAAGIIPGVISASGLGPNLTALILNVAGGSLVLLLVITAISSIILGMGMPTTVTYIILVSMLGPAISEFGIPILAAHLFILYFGVIADITPPVAVAAYAASGVAKSDPFETGIEAFSLSLNKAIVPFAFVLTPGILLIRGTGTGEEVRVLNATDFADLGFLIPEVVIPVVGVFVGVVALGATVIGYLYTDIGRNERAGFSLAALLLIAPGLLLSPVGMNTVELDLAARAAGALLFAALVVLNRSRSSGTATAAPA
ncbi:TRAP transporter permease [Natronomonas sp. EA1]|uniref:TRAP transporter permease n=1 Tax=Natronomonas sp. EA1 TaxID=3421655 RepID=UPI003EB823E8